LIQHAYRSEESWFGILLLSGWDEPILPNQEFPSTVESQKKENSQLMEIYKKRTDDSKLIRNLKLHYSIADPSTYQEIRSS